MDDSYRFMTDKQYLLEAQRSRLDYGHRIVPNRVPVGLKKIGFAIAIIVGIHSRKKHILR